jgi:hypothetical protein
LNLRSKETHQDVNEQESPHDEWFLCEYYLTDLLLSLHLHPLQNDESLELNLREVDEALSPSSSDRETAAVQNSPEVPEEHDEAGLSID